TPTPATASSTKDKAHSMRHQTLNGARSLNVSGSPSQASSPLSSRDSSPARPPKRSSTSTTVSGTAAGPPSVLTKAGRMSRKSSNDTSPSRGPGMPGPSTTVPSAAAIQRALSSTTIPSLPPVATQDSTAARPSRPTKPSSGSNSGDTTPHWPTSPRVKSPPPPTETRSRSRRNSLRTQQQQQQPLKKPEATSTPAIVVQSSSPASASRIPVKDESANSDNDEPLPSMKASSRGASGVAPKLETVQESSQPATPNFEEDEADSLSSTPTGPKAPDEPRNDVTSSKITEDLSARAAKQIESGSDNGSKNNKGKLQEIRSASTQRLPLSNKPSLASLHTIRSRNEPPLRNMTVETETVPSVAQSTIANADRSASGRVDGSLRLKPSNETIRPKKERKPAKRKAPSINCRSPGISHHHHPSKPAHASRTAAATSLGSPPLRSSDDERSIGTLSLSSPDLPRRPFLLSQTSPSYYFYPGTNAMIRKASSKADVFEQKVANAVDEADSSDSDATFIYESNPPDQPHRSRQHHSRTPSMTSIQSLHDRLAARETQHKNPNKKISMKFINPYSNANGDGDGDRDGIVRVGSGRISGHHHIGRHGQGRGGLGHIMADSDLSMPQSSRVRGPSSRQPSQPNSPHFHTFNIGNGSSNGNGTKKHGEYSAYDVDTENAADDEQTPLLASRSPRVRTPRRRNSATLRQREREREHRHRRSGGWCRKFAGCLVCAVLLLVLLFCVIGLVFATTKPLSELEVREIKNVVASQDEIILDLVVDAINPNIVGVTVADMDVIIFAKSKHAGSDKWWREHGHGAAGNEESWLPIKADGETIGTRDGVDHGTDPIGDGEPHIMSLGKIFHFDAPLNFDGTFFNHRRVESTGEIRLLHPGNKTEAGGTERWEEVLQYPFELIVRGAFKYQLPLSTTERKVPVTATYFYDPDTEKKRLEALEEKHRREKNLFSTLVSSTPLGRFDRRALPLPDWHVQ
ncbi:hypothetical protein CC80DRAFT_374113, partial [Byssothecium circinans]